jgi:dethiobiotin synthetase
MSAIFVTGTGTDVGKTFVTVGLIRHLRSAGRTVEAIKPVVTGYDPEQAARSDPGLLLAALGRPITAEEIARIAPWRYRAALAPDMAAAREGGALDFAAVAEFALRAVLGRRDILFIEGAGGVMVPLDRARTVLDLIMFLRVPAILIAGSYLGTISHTLTALDALMRREIPVLGIVVNESAQSTVPLADTVAAIARFAHPIAVLALPRIAAGADSGQAFAHLLEGGLAPAPR